MFERLSGIKRLLAGRRTQTLKGASVYLNIWETHNVFEHCLSLSLSLSLFSTSLGMQTSCFNKLHPTKPTRFFMFRVRCEQPSCGQSFIQNSVSIRSRRFWPIKRIIKLVLWSHKKYKVYKRHGNERNIQAERSRIGCLRSEKWTTKCMGHLHSIVLCSLRHQYMTPRSFLFFLVPGLPFQTLIAFFLKLYSWAKLAGSH